MAAHHLSRLPRSLASAPVDVAHEPRPEFSIASQLLTDCPVNECRRAADRGRSPLAGPHGLRIWSTVEGGVYRYRAAYDEAAE